MVHVTQSCIECNKIKSSRNTVCNFRCIANNMEIFITQIINFQNGELVNFQNNQQNGIKIMDLIVTCAFGIELISLYTELFYPNVLCQK